MKALRASLRPGRREERRLVRRLRRGDEAAFEELAAGYFPGLLRFALQKLRGDEDLSQEIVQRTACKAVTKLHTFRAESSLFTWLCACCKNEIRMFYRAEGRSPRQVELEERAVAGSALRWDGSVVPAETPERSALRGEDAAQVHRALDELPPRYARALEWKYFEGIAVAEIGSRLEISPKAAESLLTRARGAFRAAYEEQRRRFPSPATEAPSAVSEEAFP